jgi:hypothetical protein
MTSHSKEFMKARRMKASELRLNNYVLEDGQVVLLSTNYDLFKCLVNVDRGIGFEPILLTEEWLLKFGAKELNAKRGVLKEFVLKTVRIEMSNSGNFYYKNSKLILESAHQLQNLYFALTNKELTFKSE